MAVLAQEATRILIQGITGRTGRAVADELRSDGYTKLVAGATPGRGSTTVASVPVFDTVTDAVEQTGANASFISVPAAMAGDAVYEAIAAGIALIVVYAEGVGTHEAMRFLAVARSRGVLILGPNAAGVVSPGKANVSELSSKVLELRAGDVGVVSKSGTLTYDISRWISTSLSGVSTIACLGGDRLRGVTMADAIGEFNSDPDTKAIVLLGEVGGTEEFDAAEIIGAKPCFAYIAGRFVPEGRAMGHGGAIQRGQAESADAKRERLRRAGAHVADGVEDLRRLLSRHLA